MVLSTSCSEESGEAKIKFDTPQKVSVIDYDGNIMEPFLSRDGTILFFNNLNSAPEITNLHWSTRIDDMTFQYEGEIQNVNTENLEGVASMDSNGILYFVSTRSYFQTYSSIYQAVFDNGATTEPSLVEGLSKNQAGWLNFDVEVDPSGTLLYFVDGTFDENGGPYTADIVIAKKNGNVFARLSTSSETMKNINTDALEYAACISANGLELYFTRVTPPISTTLLPKILVATRAANDKAFGKPYELEELTGFVEAATISPDGSRIYYHKNENDKLVLYSAKKQN